MTGRPQIMTARRPGAKPSAVFSVTRSVLNSSLAVVGNVDGGWIPCEGAFADAPKPRAPDGGLEGRPDAPGGGRLVPEAPGSGWLSPDAQPAASIPATSVA